MADLSVRANQLLDGWTVIEIGGEIDIATVDQLQEAIDGVLNDRESHLVVDLRPSGFMDSTGLKALVMANRRFQEAGRSFAVAVKGGPVSRLIDLSGVGSTLKVVDRPEDVSDRPAAN